MNQNRYQITRLHEGSQYVFRVAAENKVGVGAFEELSKAIAAKSPHNPPGAPTSVTVSDIYSDSCVVHWSAPMSDGGSPILGYSIERRAGNSSSWSRVSPRLVS